MKNILLYFFTILFLASCSQSRYGHVPKVKRNQSTSATLAKSDNRSEIKQPSLITQKFPQIKICEINNKEFVSLKIKEPNKEYRLKRTKITPARSKHKKVGDINKKKKLSIKHKDPHESRKIEDVKDIIVFCGWVLGGLLFIGYIVYLFFVPVPLWDAVLILFLLLLLFAFPSAWLVFGRIMREGI